MFHVELILKKQKHFSHLDKIWIEYFVQKTKWKNVNSENSCSITFLCFLFWNDFCFFTMCLVTIPEKTGVKIRKFNFSKLLFNRELILLTRLSHQYQHKQNYEFAFYNHKDWEIYFWKNTYFLRYKTSFPSVNVLNIVQFL